MKKNKPENDMIILRIILWPFKMLFKLFSWILSLIIRGVDLLFHKTKVQAKIIRKTVYEPFRIIEPMNGIFSKFETFIAKNNSTIGIILGARGTGKSALGLKMLENLKELSNKKFYAMGFKDLPDWITVVESLNDVDNDSFLLVDEGGILFSSRQSFSDANKLLSEILLVARHKDISVIFISQNSSNLEINAIRQADYLMLKPSSLLQRDFERKKIKEIYGDASALFARHKKIRGLTYIYSEQFKGFISNPLPSFWTQNISKSFRK